MEDPKSNILSAASTLFLEGGVAALNVRAIAQRAGISTIGIYSHFQGKQGILDALYIEGFQRVSKAMDVASLNAPTAGPSSRGSKTTKRAVRADAKAAILIACSNYLESAEQYQAHYQLIFGQPLRGYEPSADARKVGAAAYKVLKDLVGQLLPSDANKAARDDAAIQVWSVVHGFVGLHQHAVTELVDMRQWRTRAMRVLEVIVEAIAAGETAAE